ncbi:hypothetical protein Hdeb2414_s0030g00708521 [Helianthus debilis subsp. tardiflorus]
MILRELLGCYSKIIKQYQELMHDKDREADSGLSDLKEARIVQLMLCFLCFKTM